MTREAAASPSTVTPEEFGVGVRFSLHPMTDDFVELILGGLEQTDPRGLTVETDEVSTYLGGSEQDLVRYLIDVIGAVARTGVHTVAHILFSRGCPGGVTCELPDGTVPIPGELSRSEPTGLRADADWSLYPLHDGSGEGDHMAEIERAIAAARQRGTFVRSVHYATRLRGDLADVVSTVCDGWLTVGRAVPHVVAHVTISLNSPSEGER